MTDLLSIFGTLERFLSEDLYPYRYPLTALLVLVSVGALIVFVRLGGHLFLLRHRLATAAVALPLLVASVVMGNYLLSPLWERSRLEESSPLAAATIDMQEAGIRTETEAVSMAQVVRSGSFRGADSFHFAMGRALLIETEPGRWVVRFEDFSVRNGPDLYVYLSHGDTARVDEALNLGRLKATDGAFNYEVPPGVSVSEVTSVVVWCKQFTTLFGSATLELG